MTVTNDSQILLARCVELAAEKKARDMVSLALGELTVICDYFLIMTANSTRQAQALCDYVQLEMKAEGNAPRRVEGYRDGRWILLDFGGVVAHIFLEDERGYYDLERLWGDAEKITY